MGPNLCRICGADWNCEHQGLVMPLHTTGVDGGSYEHYLEVTSRDQAAPFDPFSNPDHARVARIYDPEFVEEEEEKVCLSARRRQALAERIGGSRFRGASIGLKGVATNGSALRRLGVTMEEAQKAIAELSQSFSDAFVAFSDRCLAILDLIMARKRRLPGPPAPPRRRYPVVRVWQGVSLDRSLPWGRAPPLCETPFML